MNIITIFLALSVGCTTSANTFLNTRTLFIIVLGLIAFSFGTAAGVLCGKVMYKLTGGQVTPLIGSLQLPADARNGPQRGRRYRLRCCSWYPDQHFRLSIS